MSSAYATDPTSAFGGIIAFNRTLDGALLEAIIERQFVEVVVAPEVEESAVAVAKRRKERASARVWSVRESNRAVYEFKRVGGGLLVQTADDKCLDEERVEGRDAPRTDRSRNDGSAVRVEGGVVRQIERDRVRQEPARPSASARAR